MFGTKERIKELESRKTVLLNANEELRAKITETKECTREYDRIWKKGWVRGGNYGAMRNLKDFEEWKETVFWKYSNELGFPNTCTLKGLPERELIGNDMIKPEWNIDFDFNICAYCDMVLPTSGGPIVHLIDPFGDCTLPPAKTVSNEDAQELLGTVILAKCIMRYYQKDYEVVGFEKLPYTLYEKVA